MFEAMDPALRKSGKSALFCKTCGKHLTKYGQEQYIRSAVKNPCCRWGSVGVAVIPSSVKYMDSAPIPGSFWFHSTDRPHWILDVFLSHHLPILHVGSRYSALDRAAHEKYTELFKIQINRGASVDPEVYEDVCDGWEPFSDDYEYDVSRYVNMWESPGSISLLIKPTAFTVVDHWQLV